MRFLFILLAIAQADKNTAYQACTFQNFTHLLPTLPTAQAIYPLTFGNETDLEANPTAYYDPVIVETINRHNVEAASLADCVATASVAETEDPF